MRISRLIATSGLCTALLVPVTAFAEQGFFEALSSGNASGSFRLRSESVDDSVNDKAHALTLRTRLAYSSAIFHGFSGSLEFDQISILGGEDEFAPQTAGYATIADPRSTQFNQAYISYQYKDLQARLGRQRIVLDNQRFVGAVGWRQNDQTFDALSLNWQLNALSVHYSHIDRVHGILPAFDADTSHHLFNLRYQWQDNFSSTAYAYRLKDNDDAVTDFKHANTYGVRLNGSLPAGGLSLDYTLEAARQDARDFDADYLFAEVGASLRRYQLAAAYERLGSDGGDYGFQTPLATKHAFNGWADIFLNTPDQGLEDSYIKAGASWDNLNLLAFYHRYQAVEGSDKYGSEVNLQAVYSLHSQLSMGVKYADYRADDFGSDTEKFWVWTRLTF